MTKTKKKEAPVGAAPSKEPTIAELLATIAKLSGTVETLNYRFDKAAGDSKAFQTEADTKDIETANISKEGIDPKIVTIVEEALGVDFGIGIEAHKDKPGFLFTIVVPPRLSDLKADNRPMVGEDGVYVKKNGEVVTETYFPEDRRSKSITSAQGYDAIRSHVDQIRSNIVLYYQKLKQPLPEFKVRN